MKLKKIRLKEIEQNIERYYKDEVQFFIKIKHVKGLQTAYLYSFEGWDDELEKDTIEYRFQFEDDELYCLDEGLIQHIYILGD